MAIKKDAAYYQNNADSLGWGENFATLDKERAELLKQYVLPGAVLDVGCGLGIYVDFLEREGFDATGVDLVAKFIKEAKKNKKGKFIEGRAENLPFNDETFETVLLMDILEHGDDTKILEEASRVAKKRIIVIVPRRVDPKLEQAGVIFRHYIDKSHLREYQEEDIEQLAKSNNLKIFTLKKVHPLHNETVFFVLFKGSIFLKKLVRKIIFWILNKEIYYNEFLIVLGK